ARGLPPARRAPHPLPRPLPPWGGAATQTISLHFPGTGTTKSFGPFHVQVQSGAGGQGEFRLFDAFNSDFTAHVPLVSGDTTRLEVRLYDSTGVRRTTIPGGAEIRFQFTPDSL